MNFRKIRAYKDNIIAAVVERDTGRIIAPETAKTTTVASRVLDVGPDFKGDALGKVQPGDIVFCKQRWGLEQKMDGKTLVVIEEQYILAVVPKDAQDPDKEIDLTKDHESEAPPASPQVA